MKKYYIPIFILFVLVSCNSTKKSVNKEDTVNTEEIDSSIKKEIETVPIKVIPKIPKKDTRNIFISLKKTACSGDCPVYEATVFKDGMVIYKGIKSVLVKGKQEFKLTDEAFEKLKQMFAKTSFKNYNKTYANPKDTDFSSIFITHKNKQVEIKLWKNVPKELAFAYEYLEGLLLEKKLFE